MLELLKKGMECQLCFYQYQTLQKAITQGLPPVYSKVWAWRWRGQIGVILALLLGKSTLMNIIGGVDRADDGTVEWTASVLQI